MEILYILVPASVLLLSLAMWLFMRAVDDGQFDDLNVHALDIFENEEVPSDEHPDQ